MATFKDQSVIEVKQVDHSFSSEKNVLKDISFRICSEEKVALLGENGVGKTTLLRIISGLIQPTRGEVLLFGESLVKTAHLAKKNIGWVPTSELGFFSRLTGRENLFYFSSLNYISRQETQICIEQLCEFLPLKEALITPFYLCSTGMKQALSLCRALCKKPKILILDEPTRGLDAKMAKAIGSYIYSLKKVTVLFSTHSVYEANAYATRQLHLERGSLQENHFTSDLKEVGHAISL